MVRFGCGASAIERTEPWSSCSWRTRSSCSSSPSVSATSPVGSRSEGSVDVLGRGGIRLVLFGPITWQLPYNASLTLRQIGAVLFLAGVGIRSGYAFVDTLGGGVGLELFLLGVTVTTLSAIMLIVGGVYLLRTPTGILAGMLAGMVTQPAVLAFATDQTKDDLPNAGYATVYAVATLTKIFFAQAIVLVLQ